MGRPAGLTGARAGPGAGLLGCLLLCAALRPALCAAGAAPEPAAAPATTASEDARVLHLLSVSDTHGWIYGHRHEPERDLGEYGYFLSYVERTRAAMGHGEAAFLVDGGDKIEGTGLSDGVRDGTVKGYYIHQASRRIPWDLQVAGNHDLSRKSVTDYLRDNIDDLYGSNYLTTNIFLLPEGSDGSEDFESLETLSRHTHLYTTLPNGLRVLSFGFMYGGEVFEGVKTVSPREVLATEKYQALLREHALDTDLLILADHISGGSSELEDIRSAIRAVFDQYNNTAPILLVAGHSHSIVNKFCPAEDTDDPHSSGPRRQCYIVEAKRYMEVLQHGVFTFEPRGYEYEGVTYGGVQLTDVRYGSPEFNRAELAARFGLTPDTFMTENGQALTDQITAWVDALGLSRELGCAKYDYPNSQSADPNIYDLWLKAVVPSQVVNDSLPNAHLSAISPGSCRAPIYAGPVIRDDVFSVMPFPDEMLYFPDLPGSQASCLFNKVNHWSAGAGPAQRAREAGAWAEGRAAELRAQEERMAREGYVDADFPRYTDFPAYRLEELERVVDGGSSYVTNFDPADLDPDALYDVSMLDYDAPTFEEAMRAGGECNPEGPDLRAVHYPAQPDPTAKTDDMLANFFDQYMRCDGADRTLLRGDPSARPGPGLDEALEAGRGEAEAQRAGVLGAGLIFSLAWAVAVLFTALGAARWGRRKGRGHGHHGRHGHHGGHGSHARPGAPAPRAGPRPAPTNQAPKGERAASGERAPKGDRAPEGERARKPAGAPASRDGSGEGSEGQSGGGEQ